MKKRIRYNWVVTVVLFLLAVLCLLTVVLQNSQAALSKPLPLT